MILHDNFFKYIDKDKIKNSVLNSLNENNQNNSKKELELLNKRIEQINDNLDTIYIRAGEVGPINSTMIMDLIRNGADLSKFLPEEIIEVVKK